MCSAVSVAVIFSQTRVRGSIGVAVLRWAPERCMGARVEDGRFYLPDNTFSRRTKRRYSKGGNSVVEYRRERCIASLPRFGRRNGWKELCVPSTKKDDKLHCGIYRAITLLSAVYKVFYQILCDLLSPIATASPRTLGQYQAGFIDERGTTDQMFTFRQVLQQCHEYNVYK